MGGIKASLLEVTDWRLLPVVYRAARQFIRKVRTDDGVPTRKDADLATDKLFVVVAALARQVRT